MANTFLYQPNIVNIDLNEFIHLSALINQHELIQIKGTVTQFELSISKDGRQKFIVYVEPMKEGGK